MGRETSAESVVRRPGGALRGLVHRYSGYRFVGFGPGRHVGLPGRHVTLIVSLADAVTVAVPPDPHGAAVVASSMVGGLHPGPVVIAQTDREVGIHVDIEPWAVPALFGCSPAELASEVVGLDDLLAAATVRELEDRVRAAAGWDERFAVLDDVLVRRVGVAMRPVPEVGQAWRRIVDSSGSISVAALAAEVGWSRRHLTERFRDQVGLPPKAAARVVRFQRAVDLLKATPTSSLAALAAVSGYADQPHLNREFLAMTGLSPTSWLAAESLPFVQDDRAGSGADWAA